MTDDSIADSKPGIYLHPGPATWEGVQNEHNRNKHRSDGRQLRSLPTKGRDEKTRVEDRN